MNSEILRNFIYNDHELSSHKDYLDKLTIPSVDISLSSDIPMAYESRFAGVPFVSKNFVWPIHKEGEYRFLGQINFSEINNRPESLPESGLLSLFYAFDEEGNIFWGDDGYIIGYYWPEIGSLSLYSQMRNSPVATKKIVLNGGIEIPRHVDLRKDWPFNTDALYDLLDLDGCYENYMLGYPSYYTLGYDPTPGDEWISLITLASDNEFNWCWHDGDKLMVFIEKDKLAKRDFSYLKTDAG
jgi:uncharacterized protein YwqG